MLLLYMYTAQWIYIHTKPVLFIIIIVFFLSYWRKSLMLIQVIIIQFIQSTYEVKFDAIFWQFDIIISTN